MELGVALPTSGRLASPGNIVRIAQEVERLGQLEPARVDEVLFSNQAAGDLDGEVRLLEELRAASAGG
jgi:hypothetical protein